jgi:hypothetical protein
MDVGIYYNRVRCPKLTSDQRIRALQIRHPEAVLIGESVLHAAGWITQRPARLAVAAMSTSHPDELEGIRMHRRSVDWFSTVAVLAGQIPAAYPVYGLNSLHPAVALADLYGDPECWHPDSDDLYIEESDAANIVRAATVLNACLPDELRRLLATLGTAGNAS